MELGTKENPIYVDDDDEVRCEGCGEDGHILWDCTREYQFDEERQRYVPIVDGESLMEQNNITITNTQQ
jgi:hypothetical protein